MKTTTLQPKHSQLSTLNSQLPCAAPSEERVLQACREAADAERNYALKAVTAGLLLMEFQAVLSPLRHSGATGRFLEKDADSGWRAWLQKNGISETTSRRWMAAAERVARVQLRLPTAMPWRGVIDVEGVRVPLSQALTAPEEELPEKAREFRQGIFDFMQDRTISEALTAAIDGESPASRISKAVAGNTHGGAPDLKADPEAREQFALFAGRALADAVCHIGARIKGPGPKGKPIGGHWPMLSETQKQQVREYLGLFLRGLDEELLPFVADAARKESAWREKGHGAEPKALKAVVEKALASRAHVSRR